MTWPGETGSPASDPAEGVIAGSALDPAGEATTGSASEPSGGAVLETGTSTERD